MSNFLQTDQEGALHLPATVLGEVSANRRYRMERQGDLIILRPEAPSAFWQQATPDQRIARWHEWAANHPHNSTPLPDAALHRDSIYDE